MSQPLVSIGIPTVSRLAYLREAVAAALGQTWPNVEVLIGDDGTSEEIREFGTALAARDPRVKYQRNSRRLGLAGNWNEIAGNASGDFIAFLGDDDRLLPTFIERLLAGAASDTAVAFCNHHIIDAKGLRLPAEATRAEARYHRTGIAAGRVDVPAVCAWRLAICPSAALVRREHVLRLGFREELNSPDVEFFIRLAGEGARFDFVEERLVEFRTHPAAATASGLRHEALVARLLPIAVTKEIEPFKRELIEHLIVNAVSRCLQQGRRDQAQVFLRSAYYPKAGRRGSRFVQRTCAVLPASVGSCIYRTVASIKSRVAT